MGGLDPLVERLNVIKGLGSAAEIWEALISDADHYSRLALADNPNTPGEVLEKLVGFENSRIWERIASNPNTPVTVLDVLCEVALEGKFLGVEYLALKLAGNPNVPVSRVVELFWVSGACWGGALREAVPSNVLVEVLRGQRFSGVNENMPREWLWGLVESVAGSVVR